MPRSPMTPMMLHKETTINGQRIAYHESRGKGPPVLFIHGNSMSGYCFARQFASPLGEQYHLVALDLPGHGGSSPAHDPKSAYTLPAYAATVAAFASKLTINNAVLVGWSLGGHVLLETMGHLQESAGLMILGAPPVGKPMSAKAFIPNPLIPLLFQPDLNDEEITALAAAFFKPEREIPTFFHDDMRRTDGAAREVLGSSIGEGNYTDEIAVAANLDKPLAVMHGERDSLINLSHIKSLAMPSLWRNAIQIIPEAGHAAHWAQPKAFNRLLNEFITDCSR